MFRHRAVNHYQDNASKMAAMKCMCRGCLTFVVLSGFVVYLLYYFGKGSATDIMNMNRLQNEAGDEYQFAKMNDVNRQPIWPQMPPSDEIPHLADLPGIGVLANRPDNETPEVDGSKHSVRDSEENELRAHHGNDRGGSAAKLDHAHRHVKDNVIAHVVKHTNTRDHKEHLIDVTANNARWAAYLNTVKKNGILVGKVYESCESEKQTGIMLLLKDEKNGGLKIRTIINTTLSETLDKGTFHMQSHYGGRLLFTYKWNLCEKLAGKPDDPKLTSSQEKDSFKCPLVEGTHHWIKESHINSYLPPGKYSTKTWVVNNKNDKTIVCSKSNIVL